MLTIQLLTVIATIALAFLAWAITVSLAWALIHGAALIERRNR